jgi:NRAMP (natural resistance-associated macrophage protein)-like metal ion transporter
MQQPTRRQARARDARARAVLDPAHVGDIQGAFGTIRQHDEGGRDLRSRLLALLAIIGPGLIVMVGDNDAGGVSTYAQAGQNYGLSLLWVLLLLIPVLVVNQEMVVRLGAVTGVGHARLINERFGRFWGWFSVGDLFLLNFLTIVTEFIGVSLSLGYFGISEYVAVPFAAVALIAITATGSFRKWERSMFVFVFANLLVIPLAVLAHVHPGAMVSHFFVPSIQGGANSTSVLLIIALVGTTVAPWQLFFQQSNIIDKRITPRWINYERTDTYVGAIVVVIGAALLMAIAAFAFQDTPVAGHFVDAGVVAQELRHYVGEAAGVMFALVLLNASLIGAGALTLSTAYAFGDVFGTKSSLHRSFSDAKSFYAIFAGLIAGAAAIVLIPGAPLGVITTSVQALAGVLLPSATVFLLLLCNESEVLGPWRNGPWLNAVATVIVGILVMLSLILMTTTVFPHINVTTLLVVLAILLSVGLAGVGIASLRSRRRAGGEPQPVYPVPKEQWTMPPLALLQPAVWSSGRRLAMLSLRAYLVVAVILLVIKAVQLGGA